MNIMHLEASPGWGGQEIRILREAEGMRRRGHEVIFAVMSGGKLVDQASKAGFTVYEVQYKKWAWPLTLLRLLFLMRKHRIDLVNTHSSLDSWIGGLAARLSQIAVVRTRHLSTEVKKGWNSRWLYGALADFVVTTCASILPMLSSQSGKSPQSMRSIATGVDPNRMKRGGGAAFRQSIGVAPQQFLVGTACFMRSWKGIDDFLAAADLLRAERDLRWVLIGGGHQETYRQKAAALKLEGVVHFTGHLDDPAPALEALDAFALLSTAHEGVSQAILQAAYLERPLIATPVGGLSEVCLDRVTGLTVAPHSPHQVATAVQWLKANRAEAQAFGQKGRELVLNHFTLEQTLNGMEEVYQTVFTQKGRQWMSN